MEENINNTYSGPHEQDPRDPVALGSLLPEMFEELNRRETDGEILAARQDYIDLTNRRARGESVDDATLQAAQDQLLAVEERQRRLPPTTE